MNKLNKADHYILVLLRLKWSVLIIVIVLIGGIKLLLADKTDPLDKEDLITKQEIIGLAEVRDSSACGFNVVYRTKHDVTNLRAEEIRKRLHIKTNIRKLETDAPLHFGNMLYTDRYKFAIFAKGYEIDPDVEIQNIRIEGVAKCNLYIGKNPNIENSACWFNPNTWQGALYITNIDVYKRCDKTKRIYRYWKCGGLHGTSSIDEHFSHFSEDERIR
jgi:hypothetical protein